REGPHLPLAGTWTLDGFARLLDTLELFPEEPAMPAYRDYRRWALESPALDLAPRRGALSLPDALARGPQPVRYVASMRLGEPASLEPLQQWLPPHPQPPLQFHPPR